MITGSQLETILRRYGIELVTKAQWGARPFDCRSSMPTPSPRFYDHHAAIESSDDAQEVRAHQQYHMDTKGWCDIAYNFLIPDPATGNLVYEGRGVGVAGGHTAGENTESHAFCILGNFEVDHPAATTLELAAKLMAAGIKERWWSNNILGHRDAPGATTSCPGRFWYEKLPWLRTRVNQILAGTTPPPPAPPGVDMATFFFKTTGKEWRLYDSGVLIDLPYESNSAVANEFIAAVDAAHKHATGKIILRRNVSPLLYNFITVATQSKAGDAPGFVARVKETGKRVWVTADRSGKISEEHSPDDFAAIVWVVTSQGFDLTPQNYSAEQLDGIPELSAEAPAQDE